MDFELTDVQRGLADATRSLLTSRDSVARARDLIDGGQGFDVALWRQGAQLGWPALAIAEDDGGLGQQSADLALVAVELGYGLASTPFIPVIVAADALGRSQYGEKSKLLQSISEGTLIASWAFAEHGQPWSTTGIGTVAQRHGANYVLTGAKVSVQDADSAHLLIVDALLDDAPARFVVPADAEGLQITRQRTLDVTRSYCDVTLGGVTVDAAALGDVGDDARCSMTRSIQLNTVLVCAELVGIGQRLLTMTVDYVKERVQFGRPVGSFQAVKHKCADMRIWVQASTAATYYAAMALDSDDQNIDRAVSVAKAYVSDAINRVAGEALQLHGGIGFTWEHDLHLYLRRARTNALLSGDASEHREKLCREIEAAALSQVPLGV
ncbi:acyl-CoA dehydrogenase family protein [Mycolicibacterium pulveris]|uniref:acyl-CoA dehydrogenase family protein n=1 Tax=Mycolicibacterium pulveris TaxID=36813 RepID=UPI003CFB6F80